MLTTLAEMHGAAVSVGDGSQAIRLEIEGNGPFVVSGVEDRLAQVLQNLIGNARSFSPPGGRIMLGMRRDGGQVVVSVDDDGPGVPAGLEDAIFRRFYTDRPEGEPFGAHSGLGLSISRQIAEAHGGRLSCVNRREGAGAICRCKLPAWSFPPQTLPDRQIQVERAAQWTLSGSSWCWRAAANARSRSGATPRRRPSGAWMP